MDAEQNSLEQHKPLSAAGLTRFEVILNGDRGMLPHPEGEYVRYADVLSMLQPPTDMPSPMECPEEAKAIDALVAAGHPLHCAQRQVWGDGECECPDVAAGYNPDAWKQCSCVASRGEGCTDCPPTNAAVREAVERCERQDQVFHFSDGDAVLVSTDDLRLLLSHVRSVQSPRLTEAVAWSKGAPTSPGWWWMRGEGADSRAQVVEVYFRDLGPAPTEEEWQHVVRFWPKPHMRVRGQGFDGGMDCYQECEWAGPIPEPGERSRAAFPGVFGKEG